MRVKTLSILGGIALLSALAGAPAYAYEEDTHFTMTYVQCRMAGFTDAEALVVASYDQGMDDSSGTVANGGVGGIIPNVAEEHLWHSIPQNGTAAEVLARKQVLWNQAISEQDPQKKLQRLGVFFHYQQDTWAHRHHENSHPTNFSPYSVPFGHAPDGHQPDRPPFDPVCALRCLEDGIGYAKSFLTTSLKRTPNAAFASYSPASGQQDSGWKDDRKGKYFHQIALDNSTPARGLLTGLIRAQIGAYSSSLDLFFPGRFTADEANYGKVRIALQQVLNGATNLVGPITIPTSRQKITTLTTAQLAGANIGSTNYTVKVYTGDKFLAGTDSNIFLAIQGATGKINEVRLNPLISGNAFERNQTDTITLKGFPAIGEIQSITIRSDDSYPGSDWYLGWVEISGPNIATKRFTLNDWIQKGKLTRTLH
ncbi:MAG: PLAT/LH2 domain-containing protein [Armatimonas sp.]